MPDGVAFRRGPTTVVGVEPAHVFICYGSLSLEAALRIVEHQQLADRSFFFLLFRASRADLPSGSTVFVMDPEPETYSEWVKPFAIAKWFRRALRDSDVGDDQPIVAYLAHPFELPANHFLYSDSRVQRVELLPDGLINYIERTLYPETPGKMLRYGARVSLRVIAAGLFGLKYHPFARGHITQFQSGKYARAWGYARQGYITGLDIYQQLPPATHQPTKRSATVSNTVLVLDQELFQIVRPDLERALRSALLAVLKTLDPGLVLYKRHPRGKNRIAMFQQAGIPAEDVSGATLAEHIAASHGASTLLGFYSTPLVLMGEVVERRIAIMPRGDHEDVLQPRHVQRIICALRASGAEVTQIPLSERTRPSSLQQR